MSDAYVLNVLRINLKVLKKTDGPILVQTGTATAVRAMVLEAQSRKLELPKGVPAMAELDRMAAESGKYQADVDQKRAAWQAAEAEKKLLDKAVEAAEAAQSKARINEDASNQAWRRSAMDAAAQETYAVARLAWEAAKADTAKAREAAGPMYSKVLALKRAFEAVDHATIRAKAKAAERAERSAWVDHAPKGGGLSGGRYRDV